jgi:putative SOS response-associated peptidase YedK
VCGRYTLAAPDPTQLRVRFPIGESIVVRQRFNVAPGDDVLAVTTDRDGNPRGEELRWGLVPSWASDPNTGLKMINARVETAAEKPAFKMAMERFRCLIIADGFYEWKKPGDGVSRKQPFWITRADHEPFAFAGLWSVWRPRSSGGEIDRDAPALRTCTILTTAANPTIAPLHDRMPIILARSQEHGWLAHDTSAPELRALLAGLPAEETLATPVGTAVNDARYDGPECLDQSGWDAYEPQATLF